MIFFKLTNEMLFYIGLKYEFIKKTFFKYLTVNFKTNRHILSFLLEGCYSYHTIPLHPTSSQKNSCQLLYHSEVCQSLNYEFNL